MILKMTKTPCSSFLTHRPHCSSLYLLLHVTVGLVVLDSYGTICKFRREVLLPFSSLQEIRLIS